ncbi:hypothetical protein AMS68_007611 [Peltaster fructicola]|uniref:Uncharacterized protein n=1 Tax=Peltaster fructicola TaxID=286661 RepID=A0A6H0Y500_9PEZI|nr:hypothetical protein AMS68_007611 [Peltaster fructicola]
MLLRAWTVDVIGVDTVTSGTTAKAELPDLGLLTSRVASDDATFALHDKQHMPQFIVPWKVSAHRHAAIALYRALLSQCSRSGLKSIEQQQLSNVVKNRFRENRYNHSKPQLLVLFKAGYSAIDHLDAAVAGDQSSRTYLTDLLFKAPRKSKLPPYHASPVQKTVNTTDEIKPRRTILDRPLPLSELTGRRHVPRLVNAGGVPMLRIKKPQPQHLSAYIRHRIKRKIKKYDRMHEMQDNTKLAESEDEWDDIVNEQQHGVSTHSQGDPSWRHALDEGVKDIESFLGREAKKSKIMAQKMQHIVDEERKLAQLERAERIRQRDAAQYERQTTHNGRPETPIAEDGTVSIEKLPLK